MSKENLKFYVRPTLKQHYLSINSLSFDFITSSILKTVTLWLNKKKEQKKLDDFYTNLGLVKNLSTKKYAIKLGYCVKSFTKEKEFFIGKKKYFASQYDLRKSNIIAPALVDDDTLCRHIQIIGASGSGKTVLIKSLFFQNAIRGGGCFVVLGKGDNLMLQDFYTLSCMAKRERDFIVLDFVNGSNTSARIYENKIINNAMSFFDLGGALELEQMIITLCKLDNPDDWGQKTVDLIVAAVHSLYKLFESKLFFDVEKIDYIIKSKDTLKAVKENLCEPTGYQMLEYMTNYKNIFKLWVILEKLYLENPNLNDLIYNKNQKLDENQSFEEKIRLSERDKITYHLKKMKETVADRINTEKMFGYILENPNNAFDKLIEESTESQSPLYAIGIAISKFGTLLNFFKRFELVLNNSMSDVNILEAFRLNKLIVMNLPGTDAQIAPLLGKMITQIIRKVNERYSNFIKPKETFMIFLDEINSWAKGGEGETLGIGDIMSVIRGSGFSSVVSHQTSLISMDMGKGIEQDQVEGNKNIICLLKVSSPKILRELNELYPKEISLVYKETGENQTTGNAKNLGIDLEIKEFNSFELDEVESFNPGQGLLLKYGKKEKFIVEMINSSKYSKNDDASLRIPIQKKVSKEYFFDSFLSEPEKEKFLKSEKLDFSSLDVETKSKTKIKQTALTKQGSKFEQQLIEIYKKDGWKVTDGTGENFEEFDAEGIDIIIEKENKVILVQAKNWFKKELGRDEAVLIVSKMENFYRQKYYTNKEIVCEGILAVNDEIKTTAPALKYLQDKEKDPIFRVETKKYKFD